MVSAGFIALLASWPPLGYLAGNITGWKLYGHGPWNIRVLGGPWVYLRWLDRQQGGAS